MRSTTSLGSFTELLMMLLVSSAEEESISNFALLVSTITSGSFNAEKRKLGHAHRDTPWV